MGDDEPQRLTEERAAASDAIVNSAAPKRLIVSGPGTGKSFTFQKALARAIEDAGGGKGLALTFIRNLVSDLEKDLGTLADVFTFHGYCKHLMHSHDVAGLAAGDYYPPLLELVVGDVMILHGRAMTPSEINEHLHNLDMGDDVIDIALERADYYSGVSHNDVVYRVLRHFEASPDTIPEYPLIVVDEFQGFSLLETKFIELVASKSPVLIAGDKARIRRLLLVVGVGPTCSPPRRSEISSFRLVAEAQSYTEQHGSDQNTDARPRVAAGGGACRPG